MDKEELRSMWMAGVPVHEIARHFRVSKSTVTSARRRLKIPDRPNKYRQRDVDPTPDEIVERARECRERHLAAMRSGAIA